MTCTIALHDLITLQAISPLLAINILLNFFRKRILTFSKNNSYNTRELTDSFGSNLVKK